MKTVRQVSARMIGNRWVHTIDNLSTEIHNNSQWWNLTSEQLDGDIPLALHPEEWAIFDAINKALDSVPDPKLSEPRRYCAECHDPLYEYQVDFCEKCVGPAIRFGIADEYGKLIGPRL